MILVEIKRQTVRYCTHGGCRPDPTRALITSNLQKHRPTCTIPSITRESKEQTNSDFVFSRWLRNKTWFVIWRGSDEIGRSSHFALKYVLSIWKSQRFSCKEICPKRFIILKYSRDFFPYRVFSLLIYFNSYIRLVTLIFIPIFNFIILTQYDITSQWVMRKMHEKSEFRFFNFKTLIL